MVTKDDNSAKPFAIGFSATATIAATLLTTMKFGEHHRIREIGLVGMRQVETDLRLHFAERAVGEEDQLEIRRLLDRMTSIEYDQVNLMKALEGAASRKHAARLAGGEEPHGE